MAKRFVFPFAESGDLTAIPDAAQPSGAMSYIQGLGPLYAEDELVDPSALDITRNQQNQLFNDITLNLQTWQTATYPDWFSAADNGGNNMDYPQYMIVRYSDGNYYQSQIDNNNGEPTVDTDDWFAWSGGAGGGQATTVVEGLTRLATDAEAIGKAETEAALTPSNLAAIPGSTTLSGLVERATPGEVGAGTSTELFVTAQRIEQRETSDSQLGLVELATQAEVTALSSSSLAVTPATLGGLDASTTQRGIVELATEAETITGTDAVKAVSPASLDAKDASETALGLIRFGTQAEIDAGVLDNVAVSPQTLNGALISVDSRIPDVIITSEFAPDATGYRIRRNGFGSVRLNTIERDVLGGVSVGGDYQIYGLDAGTYHVEGYITVFSTDNAGTIYLRLDNPLNTPRIGLTLVSAPIPTAAGRGNRSKLLIR